MLLFLLRLSRDFVIRQTAGRLKITFVCLRLICSLEHLFLVHYTVFKEHPVPELPSSHRAAFPSTRSRCSLPFAPLGSHLGFARLSLSSDSFAIIPPPQAFVNTFFHFSFRSFYAALPSVLFILLPECCNSLSTFITPFALFSFIILESIFANSAFFCKFGTVGSSQKAHFYPPESCAAMKFFTHSAASPLLLLYVIPCFAPEKNTASAILADSALRRIRSALPCATLLSSRD